MLIKNGIMLGAASLIVGFAAKAGCILATKIHCSYEQWKTEKKSIKKEKENVNR